MVSGVNKRIHRWAGLFLALFLTWTGITGVLLNHPELIRRLSVPLAVMPPGYGIDLWNRNALRDAIPLASLPGAFLAGGRQGAWISRDAGRTFVPLDRGLPESAWEKDIFCLLEDPGDNRIYAGTRSGLYVMDMGREIWKQCPGPGNDRIVSLIRDAGDDRILAFTPSRAYARQGGEAFVPVDLPAPLDDKGISRSAVSFILDLHDGSVLGYPGRLVMDLAGLAMAFLSLSGILIWVVSRFRRRFRGKKRIFKTVRKFRVWHLKIGIWSLGLLVLATLTGMLVRPPFVSAVRLFPGPARHMDSNLPWKDMIFKAALLRGRNGSGQILLSTRNGIFHTGSDLKAPFERLDLPVKVSGMGTTLFKPLAGHRLAVGSFAGLYIADLGGAPGKGNVREIRIGRRPVRCTGGLAAHGTLLGWADYRRGYHPADTPAPGNFNMPELMAESSRIPLWHALFELHNTRIFKPVFGKSTRLLIPLGGGLTLAVLITGLIQWLRITFRTRQRR